MMTFLSLLKRAFQAWLKDKAPRKSAALAFYTVFSLAPLLILVIAVGSYFFGESAAQDHIMRQIGELIGQEGAQAVGTLIAAARRPASGISATIVGIVTLLIGATGALVELQDGINRVWRVPGREGSLILPALLHRLASLGLILGIAFLLLVSLVVSAILAAFGALLNDRFPLQEAFWHTIDFIVSGGVITGLFAMIYKILPEARIRWTDVWLGAAATSILFTAGKFFVGYYIGKSALNSTYGAAGSLIVVMMWVYFSALLLYFGAEFTKVYADRFGSYSKGDQKDS